MTNAPSDINTYDAIAYFASGETTMEILTGKLRFITREMRGERILQQEIATLSYRDGKAYSRSFRWQDVPLVTDEATKLDD